jgi:chromosome partition protein MukF
LRTSAPSFDSESLFDVYEQVCDIADPAAENPRKRATNAIERLRKQRVLVRIDGTGVVSAGEFTLSKLGTAIVEFFLAEDMLTRESLTVLTRSLIVQLAQVRADSKKAQTTEDWRNVVATPLRVAVSELIGGIERRQRGMDRQSIVASGCSRRRHRRFAS